MKFLCLAYGAEKDWQALTSQEQAKLLAQDQVLRDRGDFVTAVNHGVTTVTAWHGSPVTANGSFARARAPLAGFSIIEAADMDEVVRLVAGTPCARAMGAIEIRTLFQSSDD